MAPACLLSEGVHTENQEVRCQQNILPEPPHLSWGCGNKGPQTGGLPQTVVGFSQPRRLQVRVPAGQSALPVRWLASPRRVPERVPSPPPLEGSFSLCPYRGEAEGALWGTFLRALIPWCRLRAHDLITSQGPCLPTPPPGHPVFNIRILWGPKHSDQSAGRASRKPGDRAPGVGWGGAEEGPGPPTSVLGRLWAPAAQDGAGHAACCHVTPHSALFTAQACPTNSFTFI